MSTATITDIKRFAVHDGDGIRTTVFFKGCSLRCVWCHNPECILSAQQPSFLEHKCLHCGKCAEFCKMLTEGKIFDFSHCNACGSCISECLGKALHLYGHTVTVETLMTALLEDIDFYTRSGGGITLSGGECLCQADFCAEILKQCKQSGLNTAVDTCGNVSWEQFEKILPYTDTFLFDIKAIDPSVHIRCTGSDNARILENLKRLDTCGADIEIRIPFVPGYNDDQMETIADFVSDLHHVRRIRVLPYHDLARSKYAGLRLRDTMPDTLPASEEIRRAQDLFDTMKK